MTMKLSKKIAVIADIHSNHFALEAVLNYAKEQKVDEYIFLGDYVSDYSCPERTMALLYQIKQQAKCTFIRGNREDYLINYHHSLSTDNPTVWLDNSTSGSLLYTYRNLTKEDIAFFESMPICKKMEWDGMPSVMVAHGSLTRNNELLQFGDENTKEVLRNLPTELLINAHTHIQGSFEYMGKRIVNAGACANSFGIPKKAAFVIMHGVDGAWDIEFCQVPYDVKGLWNEMEESGLFEAVPGWSRVSLQLAYTGENLCDPCVKLAMELCKKRTGECNWPMVGEQDWEEAMRILGVLDFVTLQKEIC